MSRLGCVLVPLLGVMALGCAPEPGPPNVLVLMVDALRADHLGCYGYERDTSPHIDALATESILFRAAHAQSPWTKPSIPTLFTSLYPIQHGVYEGERPGRAGHLESDVLSDAQHTLAEAFESAGFRTAAFVHNAQLPASHGFAQGFEVYEHGSLSAAEINRAFLEFAAREPDTPFFAYLHYLDVHWPYTPGPPFDRRFSEPDGRRLPGAQGWRALRDGINQGAIQLTAGDRARLISLHDGGIAEMDQRIGELLEAMRERGALERTVVLLTSDHGEELLEHGKVGHGGTLFDEVIRIPLMIRLPGGKGARAVDEPARMLDIYPTLLAAAGIALPSSLEGRDLLGPPDGVPEIVAETRHKRTYRASLRRGDWKYIRTYRARRAVRVAADQSEALGLRAGMRIKVRGRFASDGSLIARKVSIKDPGDHDVELSGPIGYIDKETGKFDVHGFQVVPSEDLSPRRGAGLLKTLRPGDWVKVEGDVPVVGSLLADKLERLAGAGTEMELEGIIQQIDTDGSKSPRAVVGKVNVVFTPDTRIKGVEPGLTPSVASAGMAGEGPFTPARLLTGEGLEIEELLFDLGTDAAEQANLVELEPERAAGLRRELMSWFERMARTSRAPRSSRARLDEDTIERLRTLGYVD